MCIEKNETKWGLTWLIIKAVYASLNSSVKTSDQSKVAVREIKIDN